MSNDNVYCKTFTINHILAYDADDTDKHQNAYVNNQDINKYNTVGKYNTKHQSLMMGTKTVSDTMDINPKLSQPIIQERLLDTVTARASNHFN
jgi:hypothetical protein